MIKVICIAECIFKDYKNDIIHKINEGEMLDVEITNSRGFYYYKPYYLHSSYFITLGEYRELQINEILE